MEAIKSTHSAGLGLLILLVIFSGPIWADKPSDYASLVNAAKLYQQNGHKNKALPLLFEAQLLSQKLDKKNQLATTLDLGHLYFELGEYTLSLSQFSLLRQMSVDPLLLAEALNAEANIHSILNSPNIASKTYIAALDQASSAPRLQLTIMANQLRHQLDHKIKKDILPLQEKILLSHQSNKNSVRDREKDGEKESNAIVNISIANLLFRASKESNSLVDWKDHSLKLLKLAARSAIELRDPRLEAYALGYQGEILAASGEFEKAKSLLNTALFLSNSIEAYESAYLWQWQLAKIDKQQNKTKQAITGYQNAISQLEHVRQSLVDGSPYTFHQKIQPLFTELSDILLSSASLASDQQKQLYLHSVQEILEQAKSAELEDYFQNECVIPVDPINLNQIEAETAIIYPVILKDRLEMLVNIGNQIHQFISYVSADDINELANEFRFQLQENQGDDEYLEVAQELHAYLFEQVEPLLIKHNIKTLLVIPDGVLRTIPMAAIHDGEQYMVEKYAVATTPGINLTLPAPFNVAESKLFAGGISEAIQGFVGLPGVPQELDNLEQNYGASRFQNSEFRGSTIRDQLASADYSIVHIATHGHFDRNPQKSFLLTYDEKLTMDLLEESISGRRDEPLELLVLSACESAAGDSRAALGLAGVALKAGARSALATLWQISDAATVRIITDFYLHAKDENVSKAEALQIAQKNLIKEDEFYHPSDWAPFLLIGNWL
ncbi:MAG: CHAT domain-containing protein [Candidatus Azotimanducaceae bacterium]|jgi:CHAT domain-containing protein